MSRNKLLIVGLLAFAVLGFLDKLAFDRHLYFNYHWFDKPMHFLGGVAVSLVGLYLFSLATGERRINFPAKKIFSVMLAITLVSGVTWEFFEFETDRNEEVKVSFRTFRDFGKTTNDSASDLVFDVLGCLATSSLIVALKDKTEKNEQPGV